MAVDDVHSSREQYAELIGMLQDLKTKLEPFVDPNSEFRQALNRHMKDLPNDDESVQSIVRGLRYFCGLDKRIDNNIEIFQRALKEKEVQ